MTESKKPPIGAVITGCSSGIGKATEIELRNRGVRTYGISRRTGVDVRDEQQVHLFYDALPDPAPQLLVTCAGIIAPEAFPASVSSWRRVIDVNVMGVLIVVREHVTRLIDAGLPGRVVLLGSPSGRRPSMSNLAYGVSKAAVHALGIGLARGLEARDIKVYTLCPSHVDTPMLRSRGFDDLDVLDLLQPEDVAKEIAQLLLEENFLDGQPIFMSRMVIAKQQ